MESLKRQAARILREQKRYKVWLAAFLCLALVVTAGTVAALTMNGQALNRKEKVLNCKETGPVAHTHNDDCYREGQLVCPLPEVEAHTHTDECYTEQRVLTCTLEESAGHQHGDECYTVNRVKGELTCTIPEGHVHGDGCYTEGEEHTLTCTIPEGHVHGDECYAWTEEKVLTCTTPEGEGAHTHTDECYTTEKVLTCGQEELPVHVHGEGCFEEVIVEADEESGEALEGTEEDIEAQTFQKIYEDTEIRVTAEYTEDANIPEGAQLVAERIATEGEPAEAAQPEADAQNPAEDGTVADAQGEEAGEAVSLETITEEVTYKLRFLADGAEVEPEGTVTFTAQLLDEDGNSIGQPVGLTYNAGDGLDAMVVTLVKETVVEVQNEFSQVAESGNVRVTVEYDSAAGLPEEVGLRVEQVTAETDSDVYAQREAAYLELAGENAVMDTLLDIGFYVGEERVEPQAPVTVTIQMSHNTSEESVSFRLVRFSDAGVESPQEASITTDASGNVVARFKESVLASYAIGSETVEIADIRQEAIDAEGTVKVIAEYGSEAGLPEGAKLEVKRIKENDAYYQEREAEFKSELGDEEAEIGLLLNIGFYVDGIEVEPTGAVAITIQILDDSIEVDEKTDIVHFSEEKETFKDVDVEKDTDGNTTMSFEAKSFSTYAVRATVTRYSKIGISKTDDLNGKTFLITYVDGSYGGALKNYTYNNGLDDVRFDGKDPFTASDLWSSDMKDNSGNAAVLEWTFEKSASGYYTIQCGNSGKYLNIENGELSLGSAQNLSVDVTNGKIRISRTIKSNRVSNTYYVTFVSGDYFKIGTDGNASKAQLTLYTKEEVSLPEKYTIRYWKNENSITSFQDEASSGGTLIGSIDAEVETDEDGNSFVRIPVQGTVTNAEGAFVSIGRLEDLDGGYVFYGWSPKSNANYRWDKAYMIYCGEAFQFPGNVTVPTYAPEGFEVDVSARIDEYIDVYAIWAAPNGIKYYGGNRQSLTGEDRDKVVEFYIRLDGKMPNEPGSFATNDYTAGLKAKNGNNEVPNPLKYWMHIYGAGKEEAVRANLNYEPADADILEALADKDNVKVDGVSVNFKKMSLSKYKENYYVVWYVCKDQGGWWHIDGTLMQKTKWTLKYDGNGVTDPSTIIPGTQYAYKNNDGKAVVHNTIQNDIESDTEPVRMGYKFLGWSTVKNDVQHTGTWFAAKDEITVDRDGQVYKKEGNEGTLAAVEGLTANQDANGVWEVTLYAQWEKVTHKYKIVKAWEDTGSIINPLIKSITFDIYRYATKDGVPIKVDEKNEPIAERFAEGQKLESSKQWTMDIDLDETDDDGNPYTYIMKETGIAGSEDKEISGALSGYVMDYTKTENKLYTLTNTLNPEKTVAITVKKTDGKNPLQGAVFKLSKKEGEKWVSIAENYTSGENGVVIDGGVLVTGSYALEEVSAPDGYLLNKARIEFDVKEIEISADNKEMKLEVKNLDKASEEGWAFNDETNTLTVQNNAATMAVNLKKISDQNKPGGSLEGAEFIVANIESEYLKSTDGSKIEWVVNQNDATRFATGADGMKQLPALPIGTYTLTETKAPDGYNLREGSIVFEIKANDAKTEVGLEWHPETVYGTEYEKSEYWQGESIQSEIKTTIIVTNSAGYALPETGGPGTAMYTLGGLAVIATSLVYGLSMRRKKRKGGLN